MMHCDTRWVNARLLTCADSAHGLTIQDHAAVGIKDGQITFIGSSNDIQADETIDVAQRLMTPGLIDPHTHLVYGGDRASEFRQRLAGATYEEIARSGGGIVSTMRATRALSEDELIAATLPRLDALLAEGVTTIEVKSGYGLEQETELRQLRAARRLARLRPVRIVTTFLGAHAIPPEFAGNPDEYLDEACNSMIPAVAEERLADAVDAFCERIAFDHEQTKRVFEAAKAHGLPVKLHAEQLSNSHGAALAASFGALSADHLEHLDAEGIRAMKESGTVATLLPGAFYFTRETKVPPVAELRAAGIPIALGTDCNPGSSPLTSLLLTMNMAATFFRMTVDECILGVTRNAARALGLQNVTGTIEVGKAADFAIWDVDRPEELVYRIGFNPLQQCVFAGEVRP